MIFFIVLTLGYILYYAAIITIDLNAKPKDGNKDVEEVDTEGMVPEGSGETNEEETTTDEDNENDEEESSVTYEEDNDGDEPTGEDDDPQETDETDDNVYNIPDEDDAPPADELPHEFAVEAMPEE